MTWTVIRNRQIRLLPTSSLLAVTFRLFFLGMVVVFRFSGQRVLTAAVVYLQIKQSSKPLVRSLARLPENDKSLFPALLRFQQTSPFVLLNVPCQYRVLQDIVSLCPSLEIRSAAPFQSCPLFGVCLCFGHRLGAFVLRWCVFQAAVCSQDRVSKEGLCYGLQMSCASLPYGLFVLGQEVIWTVLSEPIAWYCFIRPYFFWRLPGFTPFQNSLTFCNGQERL